MNFKNLLMVILELIIVSVVYNYDTCVVKTNNYALTRRNVAYVNSSILNAFITKGRRACIIDNNINFLMLRPFSSLGRHSYHPQ